MHNRWIIPFVILWGLVGLRCGGWASFKTIVRQIRGRTVKKILYLIGVFVVPYSGYLMFQNIIKKLPTPFDWIIPLGVVLIILWLLLPFFKKKLTTFKTEKLAQEEDRVAWEAIAEILGAGGTLVLAAVTVFLAIVTLDHSSATKNIAGEIKNATRLQIAPKLRFESFPVRYDLVSDTLVLDVCNHGKGRIYGLAVGLEHKSNEGEDNWGESLTWHKVYPIHDTAFEYIDIDSWYQIRVDLNERFDGPSEDKAKVHKLLRSLHTTDGLDTLGTFKAYIVCTDFTGTQNLVTVLIEPRSKHLVPWSEKEFWNRLRKYKHSENWYAPIYYMEDIEILGPKKD